MATWDFNEPVLPPRHFYGKRDIGELWIGPGVREIGDYAFSGCKELRVLYLPQKEIKFGKKLFYHTTGIRQIVFYPEELTEAGSLDMLVLSGSKKKRDLWALLALLCTQMEAEYLIRPTEIGTDGWFQAFDRRVRDILEEPEEAALRDLVYCAEEDMEEKQEECLRMQDLRKTACALERLLHDTALEEQDRAHLESFISERGLGARYESAWELAVREEDKSKDYCDILLACGVINGENKTVYLQDLGDQNLPLKTYLMTEPGQGSEINSPWDFLDL